MRKTPKPAARMALEMGCLTSNAIERESPDVCSWPMLFAARSRLHQNGRRFSMKKQWQW